MTSGADRELVVDVLVVGAGIPALYIARALHPHLSVCVVSEPGVPYESYESSGRFSAGYDGTDATRIQPARRAAGYWRLWAESNEVPHDHAPGVHVLRPEEEALRTRVWADAGLAFSRLEDDALPPVLTDGSVPGRPTYATPDDVVMDPALVAAQLSRGIEDRVVAASVVRVGLITEQAVDFVELELPDRTVVPVAARYVVLASDAANGGLLHKVAANFKDRGRRREAVDTVRTCQAVRRRPTIVVRGDLPLVSAHVEGVELTALPAGGAGAEAGDGGESGPAGEVVWLVELPADDTQTVVGPEDLRFPAHVDRKVVAEGLDRLFELCPTVKRRRESLRWSAYVARRAEHPLAAEGDASAVARPLPAKLETLGMDALVAVWPSHLAYSMVVGDVVVERVQQALGAPASVDGLTPADLPRPAPDAAVPRWLRPDVAPRPWPAFAADLQ